MPFARPTLLEFRDRITGDIEASVPKSTPILNKSVLRVLGSVESGAAHSLYGYGEWLLNMLFPDTAEGEYLDRIASVWGLTRKPSAFAAGSVQFPGTNGTVIPAGTVITSTNGFTYTVLADGTVAGGTVTIDIESDTSGSDGNLSTGTQVTLGSPIAGISGPGIVSSPGVTGGSDTETDESLQARVISRIQTPPSGGTVSDYVSWTMEVSGVTRAWCTENYSGAGTVLVVFVLDGSTPIIPPTEKIYEVAYYIESKRPACVAVTVAAPSILNVNFTISIIPNTSALRVSVTQALSDLIDDRGGPGKTLYLSQFRETVSSVPGIVDAIITVPSTNITLAASQIGVLGTITWA